MQFSQDEKYIIKGAVRELVSGIGLDKMEIRPQYTKSDLDTLIVKIETSSVVVLQLDCKEIKLLRNVICDLLRELDDFEFRTRMGYTLDQVFDLFKKTKLLVDSICY